jgi:hypothetical protein
MPSEAQLTLPLGLPEQAGGLPTLPSDRGDETQDRFRYQWAIGVVLLAEGVINACPSVAIWCEHHDDFLIELDSGKFRAVQVKTDSSENASWTITANAFVKSIGRFCKLEELYGSQIEQYEFCSNAPVYIPAATAKDESKISLSPVRMRDACLKAGNHSCIALPYKKVFDSLVGMVSASPDTIHSVFAKIFFRHGPPLRGYLDTLVSAVIPSLPHCGSLPASRLKHIRDELIRLVETASGVPTNGVDGVLNYIANNGRPEVSLRGKCITVDAAKTSIEQAAQVTFKYIGIGEGIMLGDVKGQKNTLHRKMRNAFLESQFEPMWLRMVSAESRLMEKAISEPETFDALATQLEGAVLTECKDAEALALLEPDERRRGPMIYRDVLLRLTDLAKNDPVKVEHEPKDTLLGLAGMLSGSCRFAWGVPLEEDESGI